MKLRIRTIYAKGPVPARHHYERISVSVGYFGRGVFPGAEQKNRYVLMKASMGRREWGLLQAIEREAQDVSPNTFDTNVTENE